MTTSEVRAILHRHFPTLQTGDRHPDGWSFFAGPPRRGPFSNRIVRAVADSPTTAAELKLSISSRLQKKNLVSKTFDEAELRRLVANELRLYQKHYSK